MTGEKPTDLLGLAPYGDAVKVTAEKSLDAVFGSVKVIFGPAAIEAGLLIGDGVRVFRFACLKKMAEKFNLKYKAEGTVHPKTAMQILEFASWSEEDEIAEMWAGLLASSCSTNGKDDSNLMFTFILQKLSIVQIKIISHICKNASSYIMKNGLLYSNEFKIETANLKKISDCHDIQRLDRELDYLRATELIQEGFDPHSDLSEVKITPTPLCLHFFARVNGYKGDPVQFYEKTKTTET